MLRLDPPIPIVTPKGKALAHVLIDYGVEHHVMWLCFIDETGECWTYDNTQIRAQENVTYGRIFSKKKKSKKKKK